MNDYRAYLDEIAAVVYPLPPEPDPTDAAAGDYIGHEAITTEQLRQRGQMSDYLNEHLDNDQDPLLTAITHTAAERDEAIAAIGRLITYAREYAPGKRPSLRQLAIAAGKSESWAASVTTPEIQGVVAGAVLGVRPGNTTAPPADPEVAAINTQIEILDGQQPDLRDQILAVLDTRRIRDLHPKLDDTAAERVIDYLRTRYHHTTGSEH